MSVPQVKSEPSEENYYAGNGHNMHARTHTTTHHIDSAEGVSFLVKEEFDATEFDEMEGLGEDLHAGKILPDCSSLSQYSEGMISDNSDGEETMRSLADIQKNMKKSREQQVCSSPEPSPSTSKRKHNDDDDFRSKHSKLGRPRKNVATMKISEKPQKRREKVHRRECRKNVKPGRKKSSLQNVTTMERHFENHTQCGGSLAYNNNDKSGGDVLHNLLSSWNLRHLLDYFEAEHITMNVLKIVTKEDLPELTQNMKIGDKVMFKHHFEKWRAENNDSHTSPLCCTSSSNCSSPSSGSECELEKAKQKIKTIDILKQHKQGCLILENYKKNDKITEDQRNMLINIIVQHFETKDIKMTMEISRRIETELLKLFPTEKLQFYRTGSRGKIYIKFHNNNKRLGKTFKSEAKTNSSTSPKNQKLSKLVPERDAAVYVEILKSKIHLTAENFMSTWAACAKFRLNQIHNECKNMNEALKLWPQYNEVNGFQLIDSDFHIINEQTTPQVEWKGKFAKLFEFVRSQLKRYIKDLVPPLQADGLEIDTDAYMFKILWCLHFHLYPTKKFPRTNENGEKELVRPSTKDSQESFVYIGETAQGLEEHIALLKRKGEQIPPFLMGLGEPKALHATTFYVLLDGQLMAFKSFSAAFDICFKSFHLFNIDYPGASWTFWSFIEKYLYGINRTYQQNSKVCILVDELSKM